MLTLWGRTSSINVQKVLWCLDELGLPYQRHDAGGAFGVVNTPEYRRLNPTGLVPTIEDNGFVLWESNAIVRHYAAVHAAGTLWPADPRHRAEADRWMDWQTTFATPSIRDAFWQLIRMPEDRRDPDTIARSLAAGERAAEILDDHIDGRDYLAGDAFSVADIAVGAHVHRWLRLPVARTPRPRLEAWCDRLRKRPGAAGIVAIPLS